MSKPTRNPATDLRAAARLTVEATERVTDVVEAMHTTIASGPAVLGAPLAAPVRAWNGLVYGAIRGVTRAVGAGLDAGLAPLVGLLADSEPGPEREIALAVLNGVVGDHLAETGNPLALDFTLRPHGPATGRKLLVLVHGSCAAPVQWRQAGHHHGEALASALGFTPIVAHYNSGLHISTNGRALAGALEALLAGWPEPVEEVVLLGHSMGGLVARSAIAIGEGQAWRSRLRALITLGSPHHGAPLERVGNLVGLGLGISRYSEPIGRMARLRSAGVTDLRHGNLLDTDWAGHDRFAHRSDPRQPVPLPAGVACFAVAGTRSREGAAKLADDGIVPVESALGLHANPAYALAFSPGHTWVAHGVGHLALLGEPAVGARLSAWLASPSLSESKR